MANSFHLARTPKLHLAHLKQPPPLRGSPPLKSSSASVLLILRPLFRGLLCVPSLRQKVWRTIFFCPKPNFKIFPKPRRASQSPKKLSRYGSSALSGVENLTLLVGKESVALALIRHFGSLKAFSRASFQELRQFLPQRKAEAVVAALSSPPSPKLSTPHQPAWTTRNRFTKPTMI